MNPYKSKLRSCNKPSSDNKSDPFSPKSEISKNSKKKPRNTNAFSRKYSKTRCNDCKELINEEELLSHRDTCQKKCPYCSGLFPSRLINSHINVCNTGSTNLPNIGRNNNSRSNEASRQQGSSFIRKKTNNAGNQETFNNTINFNTNRGTSNNPNLRNNGMNNSNNHANNHSNNRSNNQPMFPNINQTNLNSPRRNPNTSNNPNGNIAQDFFSIFEDFPQINPSNSPPNFFNQFSQDSNGNHFFFSSDFNAAENNRQSANPFMNNQQERDRNPFVFHQRNNREENTNHNNNNTFFNSNNNNNTQNGFNPLHPNPNPFNEFDRIFGPSGVFSRIREEIRNLNFGNQGNSRENRARGLNTDELNNIPTSTFNPKPSQEKKEQNTTTRSCVVCLDDFKLGDQLKTLVCGHKFHKTCIDHWLVIKGTCPVCRVNLSSARPDA